MKVGREPGEELLGGRVGPFDRCTTSGDVGERGRRGLADQYLRARFVERRVRPERGPSVDRARELSGWSFRTVQRDDAEATRDRRSFGGETEEGGGDAERPGTALRFEAHELVAATGRQDLEQELEQVHHVEEEAKRRADGVALVAVTQDA